MNTARRIILLVDDDADDRLLMQDAFEESQMDCRLHLAEDGNELMDYLNRRGKFAGLAGEPYPEVILLDLNMPRKDGRQALQELKSSEHLRHIPIIIFTTSKSPEDIAKSYSLGANSFVVKPISFEKLLDVVRTIGKYWLDTVTVRSAILSLLMAGWLG